MDERLPRLSIGLPVYNGDAYLSQTLESLLGQTFTDFELVISDNASTDGTEDVCHHYQRQDDRIRLIRQSENIGAAPNHDAVLRLSRGQLFKWAGADDLFARDLLRYCVQLLDDNPRAILAHSWTAAIDGDGHILQALEYPLATDAASAPERFRSFLLDHDDKPGAIRADDFYGVIRAEALREIRPHDSYYHADQTFMAQLVLRGAFVQHPDWLYFRRHHPGRAFTANPTISSWSGNLDPRRRDRRRNPAVRLVSEYVWGYVTAIAEAPLSAADRRRCYRYLGEWAATRVARRASPDRRPRQGEETIRHDGNRLSVEAVVAGQGRRP